MKITRDAEVISGFTLEQPFPTVPAITHCGEAMCSRLHRLEPHSHPGIEIMYLLSGGVRWQIGNAIVSQASGELCIFDADRLHATAPATHPEFRALYVGLKLRHLGRAGACLAGFTARQNFHNLGEAPEFEPILRGLFQYALSRQMSAKVARSFAALLVAMANARSEAIAMRPNIEKHQSVLTLSIQKAVHHLNANLSRRVAVTELARVANKSPSYFATQFSRELGSSPAAYHRKLRLEAARDILRTPGASVTEAAHTLGFASSQHLSTLFKEAFRCTPREWRRSIQ